MHLRLETLSFLREQNSKLRVRWSCSRGFPNEDKLIDICAVQFRAQSMQVLKKCRSLGVMQSSILDLLTQAFKPVLDFRFQENYNLHKLLENSHPQNANFVSSIGSSNCTALTLQKISGSHSHIE